MDWAAIAPKNPERLFSLSPSLRMIVLVESGAADCAANPLNSTEPPDRLRQSVNHGLAPASAPDNSERLNEPAGPRATSKGTAPMSTKPDEPTCGPPTITLTPPLSADWRAGSPEVPGDMAEAEAIRRKYLSHEASIKSIGSLHYLGVISGSSGLL